jgi:AcrR family transcriptional regulator
MPKSKDQDLESILSSVIELETKKGALRWSLSDLSRKSGVTRSLIYYYFGKDKKELLRQAVEYYVTLFFGFRLERAEKIKKGEFADLILTARKRLSEQPYFLQFYIKHRVDQTELSPLFDRAEKDYLKNLEDSLPKKRKPWAKVIWALVFGLALQPRISHEDLLTAEKILRRAWKV